MASDLASKCESQAGRTAYMRCTNSTVNCELPPPTLSLLTVRAKSSGGSRHPPKRDGLASRQISKKERRRSSLLWSLAGFCSRNRRLLFLLLSLTAAYVLIFLQEAPLPPPPQQQTATKKPRPSLLDNQKNETLKYILYATPYCNQPDFQFGIGRRPFQLYNCPVDKCVATNDPKYLKDGAGAFDAVLVSAQAYDFDLTLEKKEEISKWRQPYQRFVFLMMESPAYLIRQFNNATYSNFFNWTMTYRWESDIPRPYGWFSPKAQPPRDRLPLSWFRPKQPHQDHLQRFQYATPPPEKWIPYNPKEFHRQLPEMEDSFHALAKKPSKVAWIVSHCHTASKREAYVEELQKHIQVDVFGKCDIGKNKAIRCDKPYSIYKEDNCSQRVQQDYKFFLGFENRFCNDYVTEKFFRRTNQTLVIAMTQANLTRLAPPHSHLNVMDFESPKALAEYLLYLDQNPTEYLSYFWWKQHYEVHHAYSGNQQNNFGASMCHLCEKLHEDDNTPKMYSDLVDWWRGSGECSKQLPDLELRTRAHLFGPSTTMNTTTNKTVASIP
jgi:alpha-1,3-fucosyltransferase